MIDLSRDGKISNTTQTVSIDDAHNQGLHHRGVWLHIVNEHNEVLLLKRSSQAVTCPSSWNAPGEHTQPKESYVDAAYRGLREELGLEAKDIKQVMPLSTHPLLLEITYAGPVTKHDAQWTQSFLVHVHQEDVHMQGSEASDAKWIPIHTLRESLLREMLHFCEVTSFLYSSEDWTVSRQPTTFYDMLLLHVDLIRKVVITDKFLS